MFPPYVIISVAILIFSFKRKRVAVGLRLIGTIQLTIRQFEDLELHGDVVYRTPGLTQTIGLTVTNIMQEYIYVGDRELTLSDIGQLVSTRHRLIQFQNSSSHLQESVPNKNILQVHPTTAPCLANFVSIQYHNFLPKSSWYGKALLT